MNPEPKVYLGWREEEHDACCTSPGPRSPFQGVATCCQGSTETTVMPPPAYPPHPVASLTAAPNGLHVASFHILQHMRLLEGYDLNGTDNREARQRIFMHHPPLHLPSSCTPLSLPSFFHFNDWTTHSTALIKGDQKAG
jgi:hypothetical protein